MVKKQRLPRKIKKAIFLNKDKLHYAQFVRKMIYSMYARYHFTRKQVKAMAQDSVGIVIPGSSWKKANK